MDKWVITYNQIDHGHSVFYDYETIEGKNPRDALQKRFKTDFKRLTGDSGSHAEVILQKGFFERNMLHFTSNGAMLCYERLK